MSFAPTAEQEECLRLFMTHGDLAIEAGAGAGKTSTLILLAEAAKAEGRTGRYIAFNRAIVQEADKKMPDNVGVSTIHSLAIKSAGSELRHRLGSNRMKGWEIARAIGLQDFSIGGKRFQAGQLAGFATNMVVRFCQSDEAEITTRHLPYIDGIDMPDPTTGARTYFANRELAAYLLPYARRIWEDGISPNGQLPFRHDYYVKLWERSNPRIDADFVMVDEAQDLSPVLVSIVNQQVGVQRVYVGDSAQQIYEFTGAINALATIQTEHRTFLTQSFRFGAAVADLANRILSNLENNEMVVRGFEEVDSVVQAVEVPDAILTRTNAVAVRSFFTAADAGLKAHIVGGSDQIVQFARAAMDLKSKGKAYHRDLMCFGSWDEVLEYVQNDAQGGDLSLSVKLIEEFGAQTIIDRLSNMPSERDADIVISTAHKSKGLEWDRVRIAGDFAPLNPEAKISASEYRLAYVAVTRAKLELDVSQVGWLS